MKMSLHLPELAVCVLSVEKGLLLPISLLQTATRLTTLRSLKTGHSVKFLFLSLHPFFNTSVLLLHGLNLIYL